METPSTRLQFYGEGGKYFVILLVNHLLTLLTLGLYYPWARAKSLQYLYGETEFAGSRLTFHGTGKEMFKGFIKAILAFGIIFGIYFAARFSKNRDLMAIGGLVYLLGVFTLIPMAIHGGLRYRMSRTSWRGIHFGYRGKLGELMGVYIKGIFLTVFTLGIYSSWFNVNVQRYIVEHMRLGNIKFKFTGEGSDRFLINLGGIMLTIFTLGIYFFWYYRNIIRFDIDYMTLEQEGKTYLFKSNITAGDIASTLIVNALLIICTLGIAYPWVILRRMRMVANSIELEGVFDIDSVRQTEESYTDATGDDLLSMLDIGFNF